MFSPVYLFGRTGTSLRTSQILMLRSPTTGMMRWMESGSRLWSQIPITRWVRISVLFNEVIVLLHYYLSNMFNYCNKPLNQLFVITLTLTTFVYACPFHRVSGNPERSTILPTRASGSTLRLTTRSTQLILRSINTTVLVWLDSTCGRLEDSCWLCYLLLSKKAIRNSYSLIVNKRWLKKRWFVVCHFYYDPLQS